MRWFYNACWAVFLLGTLATYTRWVWQSGFDQGADVAICVKASFQSYDGDGMVTLAKAPACERAKAYERSLLWQLRRRGD